MLVAQSTTITGGLARHPVAKIRPHRLAAQANGDRKQDAAVTVAAAGPPPTVASPPHRALEQQQHGSVLPAAAPKDGSQGRTSTAAPAAKSAAEAEASATPGGPAPSGLGGLLSPEGWGKLCLLGVAALWGSYNPMLRLLYSQDGPPGPVAVMLFRGVLQAAILVAAYSVFGKKSGSSSSGQEASGSPATSSNGSSNGSTEAALGQAGEPVRSVELVPGWAASIATRVPFTAIAASELGLWLFLATGIQTLGLTLTTATRAGFLIQATALLTPLLASFAGEKIGRNVWIGCAIALSGCLFIASDATATDADEALFSLGGDAAILSSAFFFSLATVRLGTYARRIPSVELAAAKSVVLGTIAFATFVAVGASMAAVGDPITDLWPNWDSSPVGWAVLCYSAVGPGAAAAFLHAKGQSVVSPAEAQVIFSSTPLWSVAFAVLLLGGEPMSWKTIVGGLAVVAAGLVASRKSEADATPTEATAAAMTDGADKVTTAKDSKQE